MSEILSIGRQYGKTHALVGYILAHCQQRLGPAFTSDTIAKLAGESVAWKVIDGFNKRRAYETKQDIERMLRAEVFW